MSEYKKTPRDFVDGSVKEPPFAEGTGDVLNIDIKDDEKFQATKNAAGYYKITIQRRRVVDEYGNSHFIYKNAWKPKSKTPPTGVVDTPPTGEVDDLPF